MKFIIVSGFLLSGSSAVVDLLREFKDVYVCDGEIRLISDPYGIRMLEENLVNCWTQIRSASAINDFLKLAQRYSRRHSYNPFSAFGLGYIDSIHPDFMELTKRYIESMSVGRYCRDYFFNQSSKTYFTYMIDRYRRVIQKMTNNRINIARNYEWYLSKPSREQFENNTKEYFNSLFERYSDKKCVVMDQGVDVCDSDVVERYFEEGKLIVVDRDWRDIYISSVEHHNGIEKDPVEYIRKQKMLRMNSFHSRNVLYIQFEDLINHYDDYVCKIIDFCHLETDNHIYPKKYFDPQKSKKNIGIWKRYYEKYHDNMDMITEHMHEFYSRVHYNYN